MTLSEKIEETLTEYGVTNCRQVASAILSVIIEELPKEKTGIHKLDGWEKIGYNKAIRELGERLK